MASPKPSLLRLSFCSVTLVFVLLMTGAPILFPVNSIPDLTGSPGSIDNEPIIRSFPTPWNFIYRFGDMWCHQRSDRSFAINGNQFPVCIRCFGIFFGIPLGILMSSRLKFQTKQDESRILLILFMIALLPIMIDGVGQGFGLWESSNPVRFITGLLAGGLSSAVVMKSIDLHQASTAKSAHP